MEEAISLILRGCSLARELEFSVLNNNVNFRQPQMVAQSCDEILSVFAAAKDRLSSHERPPSDVGLEEWLRSTCSQAMELAQMQMRTPVAAVAVAPPLPVTMEDSGKMVGIGLASSSQKGRTRKYDMEKRTVRVAAPLIGNTELPPDDGFTWRKYGQKEILGCRFPRGYFRCTHQKLYHCPAKKHVQRLDADPHTFEVTYRGDHTCHMSATAPSAAPPDVACSQHMAQFRSPSGGWLSMDFGSATGSGAPATARYGRDGGGDQFPVLDMADAMFNSGSCSSNSMDSIFAACVAEEHHKWDKDDHKN
ncbi:WRKY transcription factor 55 [Momordica charantia]|uniref:WRKY transcription factor 55 n=1 Tax=Momordica charantia TaxID=3673 RepID=A0A6J1CZA4_MOMCH|nr:WRKY transcription factor 55 [Momordica charantia]